MDDSGRSIESLDLFNESETLTLEEAEIDTGQVGTLEVPVIKNIVRGSGKKARAIVYYDIENSSFCGNIDKQSIKNDEVHVSVVCVQAKNKPESGRKCRFRFRMYSNLSVTLGDYDSYCFPERWTVIPAERQPHSNIR